MRWRQIYEKSVGPAVSLVVLESAASSAPIGESSKTPHSNFLRRSLRTPVLPGPAAYPRSRRHATRRSAVPLNSSPDEPSEAQNPMSCSDDHLEMMVSKSRYDVRRVFTPYLSLSSS